MQITVLITSKRAFCIYPIYQKRHKILILLKVLNRYKAIYSLSMTLIHQIMQERKSEFHMDKL